MRFFEKIVVTAGTTFMLYLFLAFTMADNSFFSEKVMKLIKKEKLKPLETEQTNDTSAIYLIGKSLFSDTRLSRNNNVSCATCHVPEKGFSNGEAKGTGTHGNLTKRNVPHLYNLTHNIHFFWDGRATSLQDQLDNVIASKDELDMNYAEIVARLEQDPKIKEAFDKAFPDKGISKKTISQAIIRYEKGIKVASGSPFDNYLLGDSNALSAIQKKGLEVFVGKANCIACHFGPDLSDGLFHNVGVRTDDIGRSAIDKIGMTKEFESTPYPFFSNFKAFRTGSLRNIGRTAPYFHDGSKKTLREVVESYNKGGENPDKTGVAKEIMPLNMSENEINELVSFLDALNSKQTY